MSGRTLEELEAESEVLSAEAEVAQKRAIVAEYKKRYGSDWKRMLSKATTLVNNDGKSVLPDVRFRV